MWTANRMIRICSRDRRADRKQRSRSFEQKIAFILLSCLLQEIQNASLFCVCVQNVCSTFFQEACLTDWGGIR
jgi:hypothetical protein